MPANGVTDARAADGRGGRYELVVDGVIAYAQYERDGNRIIFTHTIVPDQIGGRGVGGRLVTAALDDAEAQGLEIVPVCSFVKRAVEKRRKA